MIKILYFLDVSEHILLEFGWKNFPIFDIHDSQTVMFEEPGIMMMPEKKYEKMLKFQVFLKNLKEEAKDEDVESGISDNEENEKSE